MRWWDPKRRSYAQDQSEGVTGDRIFGHTEILLFRVTYCLRNAPPWVAEGYVAMGIRRVRLETS